jgi:hypothetical protein
MSVSCLQPFGPFNNKVSATPWAQTLTAGTAAAVFYGVTIDSSGNTYAEGYITGTGSYGFGNGVTASGTSSSDNTVIVKYNSSGAAQWAQTVTGTLASVLEGVTIDSSGNTYAVGYITGTGSYGFGNGITASGTSSSDNTVIVKCSSSGAAQWARTLTAGTTTTVNAVFEGVTIDSLGNTYAVGFAQGAGSYVFDTGVTAAVTSGSSPLIVKYNSAGTALWAQTLTGTATGGAFEGVTIDSSGNAYAVGSILGTGTFGFGNGVTATGRSSAETVIVKYDSSGTAQWAQTLTAGASNAYFNGVTIDSSGNTYAVGYIAGTGSYGFGNGVAVTGTSGSYNTVMVKYSSSGAAQWARTLTAGTVNAGFYGVTIDSTANTYAVGYITGTGNYGFGNGVTATGTSSTSNSLIVKYVTD